MEEFRKLTKEKEEIWKQKFIEKMTNEEDYVVLNSIENDDIEEVVEKLKKEYVKIFERKNLIFEELNHSKQSEILGKLIMLIHEFKGLRGVQEVIHELFWNCQEIIKQTLDKNEEKIKKLQKSEEELKFLQEIFKAKEKI